MKRPSVRCFSISCLRHEKRMGAFLVATWIWCLKAPGKPGRYAFWQGFLKAPGKPGRSAFWQGFLKAPELRAGQTMLAGSVKAPQNHCFGRVFEKTDCKIIPAPQTTFTVVFFGAFRHQIQVARMPGPPRSARAGGTGWKVSGTGRPGPGNRPASSSCSRRLPWP